MTTRGVDLRVKVSGARGRTIVRVRFTRAGLEGHRSQRRVIRQISPTRTLTFHLHSLKNHATYDYTAGVISGGRRALVRGSFTVERRAAPPASTTGRAVQTSVGATLHGRVETNGRTTRTWFVWGEAPTAGRRTPSRLLEARRAATPVRTRVTGLVVGHRYVYRVVARNADGTVRGALRAFTAVGAKTTAEAPLKPATPPTSTTPPTARHHRRRRDRRRPRRRRPRRRPRPRRRLPCRPLPPRR